jgi:hypothetical protein
MFDTRTPIGTQAASSNARATQINVFKRLSRATRVFSLTQKPVQALAPGVAPQV